MHSSLPCFSASNPGRNSFNELVLVVTVPLTESQKLKDWGAMCPPSFFPFPAAMHSPCSHFLPLQNAVMEYQIAEFPENKMKILRGVRGWALPFSLPFGKKKLIFTLWLGAEGSGAHPTVPFFSFSSPMSEDAWICRAPCKAEASAMPVFWD